VRAGCYIALALILTGCGDHKPPPTVVIDDWWGVDYAKQGCNTKPEDEKANCLLDMAYSAHEFENEVLAAAGGSADCSGANLILWNLESKAAIPTADWTLYIDYIADAPEQHWTLLSSDTRAVMLQGTATPKEIAHTICAISLNKGATIGG
jgi:hypothetical protein